MQDNFADRLLAAADARNSCLVVGIDPQPDRIPSQVKTEAARPGGSSLDVGAETARLFGRAIIDAVADLVPAVKLQSAFFEAFGPSGVAAYADVARYARDAGLLVIADVKRNDIGSTALAYAAAYLGEGPDGARPFAADAVTVNPYLGRDGIEPFTEAARRYGRGLFVLVRTSNRSASEVQDGGADEPVYIRVARMVNEMGGELMGRSGYSSLGAVVGATWPDDVVRLRRIMPFTLFLLPGFGAQGAEAGMTAAAFDREGRGGLVVAARSIIYAGADGPGWRKDIANAARKANEEINLVRRWA